MNDDLISREDLKKHITEIFETEEKINKKWAMGLKYSLKIIDKAPSVGSRIEYGSDGQPYRLFMSSGIDNAPTVEPTFGMFRAMLCDTCQSYATNRAIAKLADDFTRPQGKWIKGQEISRTMIANEVQHIEYKDYTCSNCGLVLDNLLYHYDGSPFYKFCPNCGADMRKRSDE